MSDTKGEYPCPKCGCRTKRIMCGECWRSEFPGVSQAVRPRLVAGREGLAGDVCGFTSTIDGERFVCVSSPRHAMEHRTADGTAFIPSAITSRREGPT